VADAEIFVFLLLAVAVLAGVALRSGIPYPVALVLGGLALGLAPGVPAPRLDPDVIFFAFLPPLLYSVAYKASVYELRAYAREIGLLAVGLVFLTMVAIGVVAHVLVGLDWAPAFVLGALLAPTDPVSATAVFERLGVHGPVATILEGESLVNDATGLTGYNLAIGAVGMGVLSAGDVALELVAVVAGGVAIGLVAGWLASQVRRVARDPALDVTLSLLTPFVAYVPAEVVGASGILAVVVAGVYAGSHSLDLVGPDLRLRAASFWDSISFLLNGGLFLLIGLQLPSIVSAIPDARILTLAGHAVALAGVLLVVRFAWMLGIPAAYRALRVVGVRGVRTTLRERVVIGWSTMRGGVSLAAALAIPITAHGERFPDRERILFLAYAVVLITLVAPGLTLSSLVRRLGLSAGGTHRDDDVEARIRITRAALEHLNSIADEDGPPESVVERLRATYDARLARLDARAEHGTEQEGEAADEVRESARLQVQLIEAERETLKAMRRERAVAPDVLREVERELDLDESRVRARIRL
jgi:monovalent cation/hydrogen antiporter